MRISDFEAQLADARRRFGDLEIVSTAESTDYSDPVVYRGQVSRSRLNNANAPFERNDWKLLIDFDGGSYREQFEHPEDRE